MQVWFAMEMIQIGNEGPHVISVHKTEQGAEQAVKHRNDHVWIDGPFEVKD